MEKDILLKEIKGNVGTLTFNRPEKRNSFTFDLLVQLNRALDEWAEDKTVRVVVLTGSGEKSFSSGFDVLSIPTEISEETKRIFKDGNPVESALNGVKNFPPLSQVLDFDAVIFLQHYNHSKYINRIE